MRSERPSPARTQADGYDLRVDSLGIDGAWVFTPQVHRDERGSFLEAFRGAEFAADLGYSLELAQVNCSTSRRGVIRGIHYSDVPPGQAKYVTCVAGAVLDVVVDLREGSPGFGGWEAVRLDDVSRRAVFLTEGLGHGFLALTEQATVLYLCSTPYAPGREHGVHPLDPALGIAWPLADLDGAPVLSAKDAAAPTLEQARRDGALPGYKECAAHAARLRAETLPFPS
jgi:dTDP-4-dehydrorhamnose 3,5-epimerase